MRQRLWGDQSTEAGIHPVVSARDREADRAGVGRWRVHRQALTGARLFPVRRVVGAMLVLLAACRADGDRDTAGQPPSNAAPAAPPRASLPASPAGREAPARGFSPTTSADGVPAEALPKADLAAVCDTVAAWLDRVWPASAVRMDTDYRDHFAGLQRHGCAVSLRGGPDTPGGDPKAALESFLTDRGWTPDLRYSADGPDGSMVGMRQGASLCALQLERTGGDDSTAEPPPLAHRPYTFRIECFDGQGQPWES